jgi:hypothetical protein
VNFGSVGTNASLPLDDGELKLGTVNVGAADAVLGVVAFGGVNSSG